MNVIPILFASIVSNLWIIIKPLKQMNFEHETSQYCNSSQLLFNEVKVYWFGGDLISKLPSKTYRFPTLGVSTPKAMSSSQKPEGCFLWLSKASHFKVHVWIHFFHFGSWHYSQAHILQCLNFDCKLKVKIATIGQLVCLSQLVLLKGKSTIFMIIMFSFFKNIFIIDEMNNLAHCIMVLAPFLTCEN